MTEENKKLLLKDLCSRLPYKVKCQVYDDPLPLTLSGIIPSRVYQELYFEEMDYKECDGFVDIKYSKPYLFPFSSMTDEQKAELSMLVVGVEDIFKSFLIEVEFYHKHHIDYRGLIEKSLALDATVLNIY